VQILINQFKDSNKTLKVAVFLYSFNDVGIKNILIKGGNKNYVAVFLFLGGFMLYLFISKIRIITRKG